MGDEPYTAPLPWMVFAAVDRVKGQGILWASICAIVTAAALLATQRRATPGVSNLLMRWAIGWFVAIGIAGLFYGESSGWLAHNGRVVSALGFTLIAVVSLATTPIAEFYTRPYVRPSRWNTPRFARVNVSLTILWAVGFAVIALSHLVAAWIATPSAFTTFNWVVPIAIGAVGIHRSRVCWDNFVDEEHDAPLRPDPLWEFALAWDAGESQNHD